MHRFGAHRPATTIAQDHRPQQQGPSCFLQISKIGEELRCPMSRRLLGTCTPTISGLRKVEQVDLIAQWMWNSRSDQSCTPEHDAMTGSVPMVGIRPQPRIGTGNVEAGAGYVCVNNAPPFLPWTVFFSSALAAAPAVASAAAPVSAASRPSVPSTIWSPPGPRRAL